jgi:hypothetical protein
VSRSGCNSSTSFSKGTFLVSEGAECYFTHAVKQFAKRGIARQVGAQGREC